MSVRDSSTEAYHDITVKGITAAQSLEILDAVTDRAHGWTLREIERKTGIAINAVSGRVNQLKKLKALRELERRPCSITGRSVIPVTRND